ncbi:helix-turn-helix domain-containing protein [Sphingobacterium sp. LRF_L2]|uniref:helix-turn-helix domain-containing protein n=1 Tax=Sphingobacterium sp. LRF_L2 TaxID=3369421 RepID=UPI003F60EBC1
MQKYFANKITRKFEMSQIGNNIKKLRNVKGLSQQAFADLFGLTRGNISSYEERRAEPKIEIMLQIAKYFSIPIAELLEKQLTVNEILNFEDHFVIEQHETEASRFTKIPFLNRDFFWHREPHAISYDGLPSLLFPLDTNNKLLAIENNTYLAHPSIFPFEENAILFFEQVKVDILHTLDDHIGFFDGDDPFFGRYEIQDADIVLVLNQWKKALFSVDDQPHFWKLLGRFERVL